MNGEFVKLTLTEKDSPIYIRKSRVLSVGTWNGKTYVVLDAEEVNYEVKEPPEEVLELLKGAQQTVPVMTAPWKPRHRRPHGPDSKETKT